MRICAHVTRKTIVHYCMRRRTTDTCTHIMFIVCTELRICLARTASHPPPSELVSLVLELLLHLDDLTGGCLHPTAWKPEPKAASQEVATTPAGIEAQPVCGRQLQQPARGGPSSC